MIEFKRQIRSILLQNVFIPLAMAILSAVAMVFLITSFRDASLVTKHSDQVIIKLSEVEKFLFDGQATSRGYRMTKNAEYLTPFASANTQIVNSLHELKQLLLDNPIQVERHEKAQLLIIDAFKNWRSLHSDYQIGLRSRAEEKIYSKEGESRVNEIRDVLKSMMDEEVHLKTEREKLQKNIFNSLFYLFLPAFILISAYVAYRGRGHIISVSNKYEERLAENTKQMLQLERENWLQSEESLLSEKIIKSNSLKELSQAIITNFMDRFNVTAGAVFIRKSMEDDLFERTASIGLKDSEEMANFRLSESGLIAVAVQNKKPVVVQDIQNANWRISSGLGDYSPKAVIVAPFLYKNEVIGIIELALMKEPCKNILELLVEVSEKLAGFILNETSREILKDLVREVQDKSVALQSQQRILQETNDELEKISQYKSQFLANMSHELRTPLNSTMILAQLLMENKDNNLNEKQVGFARQILKSGKDLLTLINDILDLSKVESGHLDLHIEEFKTQDMLDTIQNSFKHVAEEKGLSLIIDNQSVQKTLLSDRFRIEQVLKNFLSNAMKFTKVGSVKVRATDVDKNTIQFAITDTGIGIAPDKLEMIFEPFRQADGTTTRKYGGTGLGLSISKQLAEMLNGEISVESEEGKGTTFYFKMPIILKMAEATELPPSTQTVNLLENYPQQARKKSALFLAQESKAPPVAPSLEGIKILVVDDDFRNIFSLSAALEQRGAFVSMAKNGQEALDILKKNSDYDLVFMDIMMPVMDGLEAIRKIRHDLKLKKLPILALTAKSTEADRQQCMEAGANDFLSKPVDIAKLNSLARTWSPHVN